MDTKIQNANPLGFDPPSHRMPTKPVDWGNVQQLLWYQEPLMLAFGTPAEPYFGFASSLKEDGATLYFCVPMSKSGLEAFMSGDLDTSAAIQAADGTVYYSADLVSFRAVDMKDMPEDDRVVLTQTGRDYADIMERLPHFGD